MRRIIASVSVVWFTVAQQGCLVANTDCESNSDCKSGRVCQDGECVDSQSEGGSGGLGASGGKGGTASGGSGGSQTFSTCYECGQAYCGEQWSACKGADITFCSTLMQCLENCSTASCSNQCGVEWTGDSATLTLHSCVVSHCPICTNK
jgi:hypothetical protein